MRVFALRTCVLSLCVLIKVKYAAKLLCLGTLSWKTSFCVSTHNDTYLGIILIGLLNRLCEHHVLGTSTLVTFPRCTRPPVGYEARDPLETAGTLCLWKVTKSRHPLRKPHGSKSSLHNIIPHSFLIVFVLWRLLLHCKLSICDVIVVWTSNDIIA